MSYLDLGLSAIRANQTALQAIGQNIANVGTDGYHRQQVVLADRLPVTLGGLSQGTGVEVSRIQRLVSQSVELALGQQESLRAEATTRSDSWRLVETVLLPGTGSLTNAMQNLSTALEQLGGAPQEPALRQQFVASASQLAQAFNRAWSGLEQVAAGLLTQTEESVAEVNRLTQEVAALNERIRYEQALGRAPNDLLDRRDQLLTELAARVDVDRRPTDQPGEVLTAAGGRLVIARGAEPLSVIRDAELGATLRLEETEQSVQPVGGSLAGLLSSLAEVRQLQSELANWFESMRQAFDSLQATGFGANGPLERAESSRRLATDNLPLDQLGLPAEMHAGELWVTTTDLSTQQRTTRSVSIDPATDTLADVVARLDAVPGLRAIWDAEAGQVRLFAETGNRFDFAGRLDQSPLNATVAGTSAATLSGRYDQASNSQWRVVATDAGQVGLSQPLRLEVRDNTSGALLRTVDVGLGYAVGEPIDLGNGVQMRLDAGTLQAGDEWTVALVGNSDETGLLSALGINSFFEGDRPGTIEVRAELRNQPSRLALSRTGQLGDTENLSRWIDWRDSPVGRGIGASAEEWLTSTIGFVGLEAQASQREVEHLEALGAQWRGERDSLSGVDVNEEMLSLLRYQQAYQSIAKFVASVNDTLQSLLEMAR